ncbi:Stk1 family PASTA domain-containing Ser/Thr kinase [Streptomyces sp. NPDC050560]|uniref:Stk1 family PASTA domain-containing Ser/Thr kinase n=1 Tax=Streptomyces sp. NPDC050560 TaxID=3365630 RepID=UPI00378CD265
MDTSLKDPLVGQVLDGRYRVDALIAVGGMATVYRALDTRLDRVLALKVMHPALAADASFVERFIREAKSVARLSHPNVVAVYDQGADGQYVYQAMEYVAGCTLRDVLRERGALQPRAALDILEPVLAALGAAHRAGFVHRDMKPENVLIGDDGRVKVADFGLVRAVDSVTNTTGTVLGTVSYLAPEQIEKGAADPRVDVYACGVVLYEMLTGRKPHAGESAAQVLYQHLNEDVPRPSDTVPGLPAALDTLVAAAAARAAAGRPEDAVALLARVRRAREGLTAAQLDAVPPGALAAGHDNAEDRTSVIPRAAARILPRPLPVGDDDAADAEGPGGPGGPGGGSEDELNRTSRLAPPPPGPPGPRGRRFVPPRRGTLIAVLAVLVALAVGAGVWYINSGQFTKVPPLLAKTEAQAKQRLGEAGLGVGDITRRHSDSDERGTVISTDPAAGSRIRDHDKVGLTISLGPDTVKVPRLEGLSLGDAKSELASAGLEAGMVTQEFDDDVDKGSVISTSPAGGTTRKSGTAVAIKVSKGAAVEVPDVTGESADDATDDLEDEGLHVRVSRTRVTSEADKGDVARQSPGEGTRLAEGDTVTLTLSKGPRMVEVPDVTGQKVDDARRTLEDAGFEVKVDKGFLDGIFGGGDKVSEQSVEGGDEAPEGSTITLKAG